MITNSNVYGSYYNSLLTGVNFTSNSTNRTNSSSNVKSIYDSIASFRGLDLKSAYSMYNIKIDSVDLRSAINNITGSSSFTRQNASSSNSAAMAVSGSAHIFADVPELSVSINQIAAGQLNKGFEITSGTRVVSGRNRFAIDISGKTHEFTVDVAPGDTNRVLQQKMAQAINDKNIGIKASVSESGGRSSLSLEAESVGVREASTFTVRDITGNTVNRTGIDLITQKAINAKYSVNGKEYISETNEVTLSRDFTATLKQVTEDAVIVSMKPDGSTAASNISAMVNSINSVLANAEETGSMRLYKDLSAAGKSYSRALSKLKIKVDDKGYMSVDKESLAAAAKDGSLEGIMKEFRNTSYGFTQRVMRITNSIGRNPAGYSGRSSSFNQFLGTGLYFNMMV